MKNIATPVFSPEHGAYVVLVASLLIGVVAVGDWSGVTTLAAIAALAAHQAQFPFMQLLRRRRIDARLATWGVVYAAVAAVAAYRVVSAVPPLARIVWVAAGVFGVALALSVLGRYKSLAQELVVFAGLCLTSPWAEAATRGYMVRETLGRWLLLVAAFWTAVLAVRVRSRGVGARGTSVAYGAIAVAGAWALAQAGLVAINEMWLLAPSLARTVFVAAVPGAWAGLRVRTIGVVETFVAVGTLAVALLLYG